MLQDRSYRVRVEGLDWNALFSFINITRAFRTAIHPAKMLLAMLMVIITYLSGLGLDEIFTQSIFQNTIQAELFAFRDLILSAVSLDFGYHNFMADVPTQSSGVIGALFQMVVGIPMSLAINHTAYFAIFTFWIFILNLFFGGSISRLAALQATRNLRPSFITGLQYVYHNFFSFLGSVLLPLILITLFSVILALVGLLFNLPVLNFIAALTFGLLIFLGIIISLLLIGFAGAANLMFPSVATDNTDAFDTISRTYNYVMRQPWRFVAYNAFALFYGAITYLFLALVIFLALWVTITFTGFFVPSFHELLPDPKLGELPFYTSQSSLGQTTIANVVTVWVKLLIALLPAFAFSYYYTAQTFIYLLLRKHSDGTELEHVHLTPGDDPLENSMDDPTLADKLIKDKTPDPSSETE
ncbi:hypothetical protein KS4_13670 [Poriferisphaera corsica]|uniref:Uncharacterized protein n=1 Tax=Poriferisphaera corsica TaxID=2528020 RepID=A0A517YSX9_9BACT|nr:hypothetical protein [Poriferisphaera corsica]QDU33321.1 hypothetical protein KS4_13670 [Poriferisphaera corsica]